MLKIFQVRLQQDMSHELPDVQTDFRKGRGTRDHIANIHWIIEKARVPEKTSISALLTMPKPLTVWITTNCGKFLEIGISDHLTCLLRNLCWGQEATIRTGHGQQTGSNKEKEYVKAVYCYCVYLTSMQSTSWEMLGWINCKLELRLLGEILVTSDMQMIPPLWQKAKKN